MFYLPPSLNRDAALRIAKNVLLDMNGGKEHPMMDQAIESFASMIEGIERYQCILDVQNSQSIDIAIKRLKRRG